MSEIHNGITTFFASTRKAWRKWLDKNHAEQKSVWLIIYHKESKVPSIYYNDAVEEALCFGWIDTRTNKRDEQSFYLMFAQRKPKSNWSKANRDRVAALTQQQLITPAGQRMIDLAKKTGTWTALEAARPSLIPADLNKLFKTNPSAHANFKAFPPSSKRMILEWIMNAKRPATREQRIQQTVSLAAQNIRANHPRK